eukprot:Selendium_serpulae@DN177_c0_g1_i1.p1
MIETRHTTPIYSHTQSSSIAIGSYCTVAVGSFVCFGVFYDDKIWGLLVVGVMNVCLSLLCTTLTVSVDREVMRIRYGPIPTCRKSVKLSKIVAVSACRTRCVDGWGIKYLHRRGWLMNIQGLDAVECLLAGGEDEDDTTRKALFVGTNDASELLAHLETCLAQRV